MSNPNVDVVILTALAQILPVGTNLLTLHPVVSPALYGSTVYIQDRDAMMLGGFPALLLHAGTQKYQRNSTNTYDGGLAAICEICDRWDTQPSTLKAIRDGLAADLEIMKHNVSKNETLQIGLTNYAVSVPGITLSPYEGSFDTTEEPGVELVKRIMVLSINILPYDEF